MLSNKIAVIYGAGGAVGSTSPRLLPAKGEGFLNGRTKAKVDRVAAKINAAGGFAEAAELDALDELAVEKHLNMSSQKPGTLISPSTRRSA